MDNPTGQETTASAEPNPCAHQQPVGAGDAQNAMNADAEAFVPKSKKRGQASGTLPASASSASSAHAPHDTGATPHETGSSTRPVDAERRSDENGSDATPAPQTPSKKESTPSTAAAPPAKQCTPEKQEGASGTRDDSTPLRAEKTAPPPSAPKEPKQKGTSIALFMSSPTRTALSPQSQPSPSVPSTPTASKSLRRSGANSPPLRKYTFEYMLERRNSPASKRHFDMTVLEETAAQKTSAPMFTSQHKRLVRWRKPASVTVLEQETDKIYATLNKLAESNIDVLLRELTSLKLENSDVLRRFAEILCDKAATEYKFSPLYALLYSKFVELINGKETVVNGERMHAVKAFRRFILDKLQREFETANWDDPSMGIELGEQATAADVEEAREKRRKAILGTIKFIGELHRINCFPQKPLSECLNTLLEAPNELATEAACRLIEYIGASFDADSVLKGMLDTYLHRIEEFARSDALPKRIKFLLQDEIELRENGWKPQPPQQQQQQHGSSGKQDVPRKESVAKFKALRASCTTHDSNHRGARHANAPLRASTSHMRVENSPRSRAAVCSPPSGIRTREQMKSPTVDDNVGGSKGKGEAPLPLPLPLPLPTPTSVAEKSPALMKANITELCEEYVSGETSDTRASFEELPSSALPLVAEAIAEYLAQEVNAETDAGKKKFAAGGELLVFLFRNDLLDESQVKQGLKAFIGNLEENDLDCTDLRVCATASSLVALCIASHVMEFGALEELFEPLTAVPRTLPVPQTPNTVAAVALGLTLGKLAEQCTFGVVAKLIRNSAIVLNRFLPASASSDEDVLAFLTSYGITQVAPALCSCCELTAHAEELVRRTPFSEQDGKDLQETLAKLAEEHPSVVEDEQSYRWLERCVVYLFCTEHPDDVLAAVDRNKAVIAHFHASQPLQITLVYLLHAHLGEDKALLRRVVEKLIALEVLDRSCVSSAVAHSGDRDLSALATL